MIQLGWEQPNAGAIASYYHIAYRSCGSGATAVCMDGYFSLQRAGFRVQGSGCRVQGAGCRVQGSGWEQPNAGAIASYYHSAYRSCGSGATAVCMDG